MYKSYGNFDGLCYAEYSSSKPNWSFNILSAVLLNCTLMPKGSLRVRHTPIVVNMGLSLSKISHTGSLVVMSLFETWNTWMQGHPRHCRSFVWLARPVCKKQFKCGQWWSSGESWEWGWWEWGGVSNQKAEAKRQSSRHNARQTRAVSRRCAHYKLLSSTFQQILCFFHNSGYVDEARKSFLRPS